jgi:4-carboxymuconolactone decarboxylase
MSNPYQPLQERGADVREHVLGAEWIQSARQRGEIFGGGFQDIVTSLVWGGVWSRPGLSLRDRSLVTVAVLAALNRPDQLAQHIDGALRNGCTREELEEALIQIGAYAGFPTAVIGIGIAQQVLGAAQAPATAE